MHRALFVAAALVALDQRADAFAPTGAGFDHLTAQPAAGLAAKPLRAVRRVQLGASAAGAASPAWRAFVAHAGGAWSAQWDAATGVPTRIWGSGIAAAGASASPAIAEAVARQWLAAHLALLAPGAAASDFALVTNTTDGNIRAVGFVQRAGGLAVLGGQVSFEFKRDRLFVIGSTALPNVGPPAVSSRLARGELARRAERALRAVLPVAAANPAAVSPPGDELIVPLIADDAVLGYRIAAPVQVDAASAGRYEAFVDPASGAPIAIRPTAMFAAGELRYNDVDRYPGRGRFPRPAPAAHVTVDGSAETTDGSGGVTWSQAGDATVMTAVVGDLVQVIDMAGSGALASATLTLADGGTALWDASTSPLDDAQLVVYESVNRVKAFVHDEVDPQLAPVEASIVANVNIDDECNAFFDGSAVNFFQASPTCENTGRIEDVIFHEFGHFVHTREIIAGVGQFDGSMSEGVADTLAVNITNDHGLGRGFFYDDEPLRDVDPVGFEAMWPRDLGEIHHTGEIFGGTWWDLRAAALASFGADAGEALTMQLYVGALRRSVDIPSSFVEALATDDDDGDLANGTPHECLIREAYGRHGLRDVGGTVDQPGNVDAGSASAQPVTIGLTGLVDRCHADDIVSVQVAWTAAPGVASSGVRSADVVPGAAGSFTADLPVPTDGAIAYQAQIQFADGGIFTLPDNLDHPWYQFYQGETVAIYCNDFESGDPFGSGWTASGTGSDTWAWTTPTGSGTTDPTAAFSGTHALVEAPGGDYAPMISTDVAMPPIDVRPYSDVHLQYRRWLAVEDSEYDHATILVNGALLWENGTAGADFDTERNHIDSEWIFQDVPLSGHFFGSAATVRWHLDSDPGLQFGGWALDDVCLVANKHSICGDGTVSPTEQCDDGSANADTADHCRTYCQLPRCGDGIVDTGEQCDDGAATARCSGNCRLRVAPGTLVSNGGCAAGGAASGASWLGGVLAMWAALLGRRRRGSARPGRSR